LKPPVPSRRRSGRANGAYQPNGDSPRYIPMQHLELAGVRRSVLVALGLAVLIPVAVAVWALTQIGGSDSKSTTDSAKGGQTTADHATAASFRNTPLFKGLVAADQSAYAKNLLPPSSCQGMSATMVVCKQPHYAVDEVTFNTYPSLKSLYAAYEARAAQLAQAPFRANVGNCTESDVNGEIGWNHDFKHPSTYPISMFTSGTITDDKAAGRMFCTFTGGLLYLLWTQDDGRILGELAGAPHLDAYLWWHNVHHVIAIPGTPNMMGAMPGMGKTTSTQGSGTMPGGQGTMTGGQSTMPKSTSTMPSSKNKTPSGQGTKSSHSMPGMSSGG
jgi:hypothetical protein